MIIRLSIVLVCLLIGPVRVIQADEAAESLRGEARQALERATRYYRDKVAVSGGYVWRYSEDLSRREGESKVGPTTIWTQPPGTPSVGEAYLTAWRATDDQQYLEAARETALALVRGQLQSGGWDYRIEFDKRDRQKYAYRVDEDQLPGPTRRRNTTTLDDNTTQSVLRFLMRVDLALKKQDAAIGESVRYALQSLLAAQYPNGAWPQRFDAPPDADKFPAIRARYPESWSREYPAEPYASHYTFNDNSLADCIDVLFEAAAAYDAPEYRAAAEKAGGFILLAQMPEPQPAWAQQYDAQMQPAWARKFEPPSVTGGESQRVLRTLLQLYVETADEKYLAPVPRAIAYLRRSRLPDGRLARFYELRTNKPLYFTKQYELTYSDADMPTHYGFKVSDSTDSVERQYERLRTMSPQQLAASRSRLANRSGGGKVSMQLAEQVRDAISQLDDQGRWVERGRLKYHGDADPTRQVIDSSTFIENVQTLSRYLAATREQ